MRRESCQTRLLRRGCLISGYLSIGYRPGSTLQLSTTDLSLTPTCQPGSQHAGRIFVCIKSQLNNGPSRPCPRAAAWCLAFTR